MNRALKKLRTIFGTGHSPMAREAATLMGGNVVAQAIAMLAYLALTRIYIPEDFALFNIFYSYIEVLIIFSTCKYELAVVVASDEAESAAMARFALKLNTLVSLALLAVATLLYLTHALPGDFSQLGVIVLFIPPMVYFTGTSRIYASLYNRVRRYKLIAASEASNAVAGAVLKALFGLLGWNRAGMPLGAVVGQAVANLLYRIRMRSLHLPSTTAAQGREAARKHRNFPLFVATKDFLNSFSFNLPFLWLALYFDKAEVGLFGLALTFTVRPANLLNSAFERVLYARTAEQVRRRRSIGRLIGRFLLCINAVALPVCLVGWLFAEPIFGFCFGGRWEGCGVYVQALLPWIFLSLSSTSLMFISNVFSTQRTECLFYLALLVLRVASVVVGIHAGSFLLAIRLYATAGALVAASLLVWYLLQVRRYELSLLKD